MEQGEKSRAWLLNVLLEIFITFYLQVFGLRVCMCIVCMLGARAVEIVSLANTDTVGRLRPVLAGYCFCLLGASGPSAWA